MAAPSFPVRGGSFVSPDRMVDRSVEEPNNQQFQVQLLPKIENGVPALGFDEPPEVPASQEKGQRHVGERNALFVPEPGRSGSTLPPRGPRRFHLAIGPDWRTPDAPVRPVLVVEPIVSRCQRVLPDKAHHPGRQLIGVVLDEGYELIDRHAALPSFGTVAEDL